MVDRRWVVDTTFLWGVTAADILDQVLAVASGRIAVTPGVLGELERHAARRTFLQRALRAAAAGEMAVEKLNLAEIATVVDLRSLWQVSPRDDDQRGEAEVIALAVNRRWGAIIDDHQARRTIGMRYPQIESADTPQVLLHLVDLGVFDINESWRHLQNMKTVGGFDHSFVRRPKRDWISRRAYTSIPKL